MSIIQEIQIGLTNGWWYPALFGLTNLSLIAFYGPRAFGKRLFHMPPFASRREKFLSYVSVFLFARGMMLYSVLVDFNLTSPWFHAGSAVFLIGLGVHIRAMVDFAAATGTAPSQDRPAIHGAYRFSRHPMQLTGIVMWIGVGMATHSLVILAACGIQFFLCRPFMAAQERY